MAGGGGYLGLKAIFDQNREIQRELERDGIPGTGGYLTCPNDGGKLMYNARLRLWRCEMGDYETSRGPRGAESAG